MSDDDSFTADNENLDISGVWGESDYDYSLDNSLNESFVSVTSVSLSQQQRDTTVPADVFKAPLPKQNYFAQCAICKRKLKTQNGFNTHMVNHRLKDLAKEVGGREEILAELKGEVPKILLEMAADKKDQNGVISKISTGLTAGWESETSAEGYANFQEEVLSVIKKGCNGKSNSTIMPMSVRCDLVMAMNECLSDKVFVDKLYQNICSITACDIIAFSLFIFDVLGKLVDHCCLSIYRKALSSIRAPEAGSRFVKGDTGNELTYQLIHHVAGFALFHHVSHARRYPKNQKLQRMKDCILSKMVKAGSTQGLSHKDKGYWTHLLNRKALFFVSDKAFPFFMKLSSLLMESEEQDGSIILEKVCEKAMQNGNMLALWDGIVDQELDESESLDLMIKTVKVVSRTYGRGSMMKRNNMLSEKGKANKKSLSISHRASLL